MRRLLALAAFTGMTAALVLSFVIVSENESRAASLHRSLFVIPADEGYGIAECLLRGGACGQVVADSWCEAHGFAGAKRFGVLAEVAAADLTSLASVTDAREPALAIACAE